MRRVVVVGGGLAGLRTLVALRQRGYDGELTLVGEETLPPYDRPPLSKAVLLGETDDSTLDADWDGLDVRARLGERATGMRPGVVESTRGGPAVRRRRPRHGSRAAAAARRGRRARSACAAYPRRRAPAARGAGPRRAVAIVRAGLIGAEVATAAARAGCAVTVVEARAEPLAGALPAEVGRWTRRWYAEAGVDLRLGRAVVRADGSGLALAGEGTVAPGVAAANLLGEVETFDPVPYFWSEQFGRTLQVAGLPPGADRGLVWRGDPDTDAGWSGCWVAADRLVAVVAVDRPRDLVQGRRAIARGTPLHVSRLADPSVPIRDAVATR